MHGLDDEKLNGKIGVLRTLVASTGKFAIELDGNDARSAVVFSICPSWMQSQTLIHFLD